MKKNILQLVMSLFLLTAPVASALAQVVLEPYRADLNDDDVVDVADIATVISVMTDAGLSITDLSPEDADAIDMGFPSGTKWANMNVGASKPEDYGLFFAWGETVGYSSDTSDGRIFRWPYYKWMNEGKTSWTEVNKYQIEDGSTTACWYSGGNFVGDNKVLLDPEDDSATASWGTKWRIPTYAEMEELVDFCTAEWVERNGVNGTLFTSKINGNSLFFPAAGYRVGDRLEYQGEGGNYWTSTVRSTSTLYGGTLCIASVGAYMYYNGRLNGRSVRAVLKK